MDVYAKLGVLMCVGFAGMLIGCTKKEDVPASAAPRAVAAPAEADVPFAVPVAKVKAGSFEYSVYRFTDKETGLTCYTRHAESVSCYKVEPVPNRPD